MFKLQTSSKSLTSFLGCFSGFFFPPKTIVNQMTVLRTWDLDPDYDPDWIQMSSKGFKITDLLYTV